MSIKVLGILSLQNEHLLSGEQVVKESVEQAFLSVEKAIKNNIGIKFGGNISEKFRTSLKNPRGENPFELVDNFIVTDAQKLFAGDSVVDGAESLKSRMLRVQNLLGELLKISKTKEIPLYINTENKDTFETIEINVNDFCSKMLELYKQNDKLTPIVKIIIK